MDFLPTSGEPILEEVHSLMFPQRTQEVFTMSHIYDQDTDDPLPFATGQNDLGRGWECTNLQTKPYQDGNWDLGPSVCNPVLMPRATCTDTWREHPHGAFWPQRWVEERLVIHRHVKRAWSDYCHFNTINQDVIPSRPSALPVQSGNNNPTTPSLKLKKSGVYLTLI